ncbi:DoxX family protein [Phreatobacter sp.]|uniref:DoxX family protein n=1 Tax=Phreatobacter sp. TaxID=1966341 RepID=UPI003F6FC6DA
MLSILRIMFALVLLQYPLTKLFGFPGTMNPPFLSLSWIAGAIELVTGALILIGFLTRPAAFLLAGTMAAAYFIGHAGGNFFPMLNRGDLAIMFCFVSLYLVFAGPGPWSVDAQRSSNP